MEGGTEQGRLAAGQPSAALRDALDRVGDRWSLLVVGALLEGPARWSDLVERLRDIAPNVLAERLRRLERAGIVSVEPYSQRPLRVTYELTGRGQELAGALRLLAAWGGGEEETPRHGLCGTPMEPRWFCPTCEGPPREGDDVVVI